MAREGFKLLSFKSEVKKAKRNGVPSALVLELAEASRKKNPEKALGQVLAKNLNHPKFRELVEIAAKLLKLRKCFDVLGDGVLLRISK